jgi:hypothetical protein
LRIIHFIFTLRTNWPISFITSIYNHTY